jgi:hypothetical protein
LEVWKSSETNSISRNTKIEKTKNEKVAFARLAAAPEIRIIFFSIALKLSVA